MQSHIKSINCVQIEVKLSASTAAFNSLKTDCIFHFASCVHRVFSVLKSFRIFCHSLQTSDVITHTWAPQPMIRCDGRGHSPNPAPTRSSFLNRIEPLWTMGGNLRKATKKQLKWRILQWNTIKLFPVNHHNVFLYRSIHEFYFVTVVLDLKYYEKHSCLSCCHSFWHLDTNN